MLWNKELCYHTSSDILSLCKIMGHYAYTTDNCSMVGNLLVLVNFCINVSINLYGYIKSLIIDILLFFLPNCDKDVCVV